CVNNYFVFNKRCFVFAIVVRNYFNCFLNCFMHFISPFIKSLNYLQFNYTLLKPKSNNKVKKTSTFLFLPVYFLVTGFTPPVYFLVTGPVYFLVTGPVYFLVTYRKSYF